MMNQLRSRRYELFRRLTGKLLIEDEQASVFPPAIERLISPTLDVTDLLLDNRAVSDNQDLSGTVGTYTAYHTIPAGERWHLIQLTRENTISNTHVEINIADGDINFQLVADATATQFFGISTWTLEQGDSIGMLTTGNAGDTNIFLSLFYRRELTN